MIDPTTTKVSELTAKEFFSILIYAGSCANSKVENISARGCIKEAEELIRALNIIEEKQQ